MPGPEPTPDPEPTPKSEDWVHEDFDEWSELTKERDGYR